MEDVSFYPLKGREVQLDMSHGTSQNIVICGKCSTEVQEDDAWLYKEEPADLSMKQFLEWYDKEYGRFTLEKPIDIPWKELVNLISIVLMVLGRGDLQPEDVARQVLPSIREPTSARMREEG